MPKLTDLKVGLQLEAEEFIEKLGEIERRSSALSSKPLDPKQLRNLIAYSLTRAGDKQRMEQMVNIITKDVINHLKEKGVIINEQN